MRSSDKLVVLKKNESIRECCDQWDFYLWGGEKSRSVYSDSILICVDSWDKSLILDLFTGEKKIRINLS